MCGHPQWRCTSAKPAGRSKIRFGCVKPVDCVRSPLQCSVSFDVAQPVPCTQPPTTPKRGLRDSALRSPLSSGSEFTVRSRGREDVDIPPVPATRGMRPRDASGATGTTATSGSSRYTTTPPELSLRGHGSSHRRGLSSPGEAADFDFESVDDDDGSESDASERVDVRSGAGIGAGAGLADGARPRTASSFMSVLLAGADPEPVSVSALASVASSPSSSSSSSSSRAPSPSRSPRSSRSPRARRRSRSPALRRKPHNASAGSAALSKLRRGSAPSSEPKSAADLRASRRESSHRRHRSGAGAGATSTHADGVDADRDADADADPDFDADPDANAGHDDVAGYMRSTSSSRARSPRAQRPGAKSADVNRRGSGSRRRTVGGKPATSSAGAPKERRGTLQPRRDSGDSDSRRRSSGRRSTRVPRRTSKPDKSGSNAHSGNDSKTPWTVGESGGSPPRIRGGGVVIGGNRRPSTDDAGAAQPAQTTSPLQGASAATPSHQQQQRNGVSPPSRVSPGVFLGGGRRSRSRDAPDLDDSRRDLTAAFALSFAKHLQATCGAADVVLGGTDATPAGSVLSPSSSTASALGSPSPTKCAGGVAAADVEVEPGLFVKFNAVNMLHIFDGVATKRAVLHDQGGPQGTVDRRRHVHLSAWKTGLQFAVLPASVVPRLTQAPGADGDDLAPPSSWVVISATLHPGTVSKFYRAVSAWDDGIAGVQVVEQTHSRQPLPIFRYTTDFTTPHQTAPSRSQTQARAGDVLLEVDGTSVVGKPVRDVVALLSSIRLADGVMLKVARPEIIRWSTEQLAQATATRRGGAAGGGGGGGGGGAGSGSGSGSGVAFAAGGASGVSVKSSTSQAGSAASELSAQVPHRAPKAYGASTGAGSAEAAGASPGSARAGRGGGPASDAGSVPFSPSAESTHSSRIPVLRSPEAAAKASAVPPPAAVAAAVAAVAAVLVESHVVAVAPFLTYITPPFSLSAGIIDVLQQYTLAKRLERFLKVGVACKSGKGVSCMPPDQYAARFRERVAAQIIENYQPPY